MSTILVIVAHPDDEILGVGATISKRTKAGDMAYALILGEGQTSRWEKREQADQDIINDLHRDSIKAAEIIGYKDIYFENFPDNRFDAIPLLDIVKRIEYYIKKIQPEIIYVHHNGDLNIDHQITHHAVLTATRPIGNFSTKELYGFETVGSTEWNFANRQTAFYPTLFEDITQDFDIKCNAMRCYKSELCEYPHPRSIKMLRAVAEKWGGTVGKGLVEAFEVIRVIQ